MFLNRIRPFVICLLLVSLAIPAAAQIQDCLNYADYLHWVACTPPRGMVGITVVDDLAYISGGADGLLIYDISQPDYPVQIGVCDTPGSCLGNFVEGNLAYVADAWSPGFGIIDVSDPANPVLLSTAGEGAGWCYDLAMVAPDTVYVTDSSGGSMVIDVSDPLNPAYLGSLFPYSSTYEFHRDGDNLYFGDDYGLQAYDMTWGAVFPEHIGTGALADFNYGVTRHGDLMYMLGYHAIGTFDIGDPEVAPVLLDEYETAGPVFRMQVAGARGYTAGGGTNGWCGLEVFDLSVPEHPDSLAALSTRWSLMDVGLLEGHALLTSERMGLIVADISNPVSAPVAGHVPLPEARQADVSGRYAYVAANASGLFVVDVDDPAAPSVVGQYDPPTYVTKVIVQGGYGYLGVGGAGLEIVDLSDPVAPVYAGSVDPWGTVYSLAVQGDWAYLGAYVSSGNYDVQIIDVSDPTSPLERYALDMPSLPLGMDAEGDYLYVATNQQGLQVLDISDPLSATIVASLDLGGDLSGTLVQGGLAVICVDDDGVNFYNGVHFVDVSDPTSPQLISTLYTPGVSWQVALSGDLMYIADDTGGLQIADISDLNDPRLVGALETGRHNANGVVLAENCVCVSDWVGGFYTAWPQCGSGSPAPEIPPVDRATLSARPNPFNPRTSLEFELPAAAVVDLVVFDVSGRRVRQLLHGHQLTGTRGQVAWDGRGDDGREVAAGVYLCRLKWQEGEVTTRVALVR
jgi:hypothetical protein